jgi:hypothetical protein
VSGWHPAITVDVRLTLTTERTSMRLTARCNQKHDVTIIPRRSCRSVPEAKRRADREIAKRDLVAQMVRKFYSTQYDVYLEDGSWFMTLFDSDLWALPIGNYTLVDPDGYKSRVRRFDSGYGKEPYDFKR